MYAKGFRQSPGRSTTWKGEGGTVGVSGLQKVFRTLVEWKIKSVKSHYQGQKSRGEKKGAESGIREGTVRGEIITKKKVCGKSLEQKLI